MYNFIKIAFILPPTTADLDLLLHENFEPSDFTRQPRNQTALTPRLDALQPPNLPALQRPQSLPNARSYFKALRLLQQMSLPIPMSALFSGVLQSAMLP
jgi:hypothetical protein